MNRAEETEFRAFAMSRYPSLLRFAHVLTGDRRLAEDVVQTALAETASGWTQLQRTDNPDSWVRHAILIGNPTAVFRRPSPQRPRCDVPHRVDVCRPERLEADEGDEPDVLDVEVDERDAMWDALSWLPPRQRTVLVLRYYEDFTDEDLADELGCRRAAVKRRAAKALASLPRQPARPGSQRTNLEVLVRETVLDPRRELTPSGPYVEEVVSRAQRIRRQRGARSIGVTAIAVSVAVVATALLGSVRRAANPTETHIAPPLGQVVPFAVGDGATAAAAAISGGTLYMAQSEPNMLLAISPTNAVTHTSARALANNDGLAFDRSAGRLWEWSAVRREQTELPGGTSIATPETWTTVRAHDASTLDVQAETTVPTFTYSAAAINGELWLATDDGLYVVPARADAATVPIRVVVGPVFSVAADPARHRVLAGTGVSPWTSVESAGIAITAIDARRHTPTRLGDALPVSKESIAVVGGQVWVGGYGLDPTSRLVRLDPKSLREVGSSELNKGIGSPDVFKVDAGASVSAGDSVLWVRDGTGQVLSCVDPHTGKALQQWRNVDGPVVSTKGQAFVVGRLRLLLNADCKG